MRTAHGPKERYDIGIIGGGIAGSALAALLARAGREVALFERDRFPRDKLCGEFLSGESRRLLGEIGCLEQVLALRPPAAHTARFTTSSGRSLETALETAALCVSRRGLDEILFRHAAASGAATFAGANVLRFEEGPGTDMRLRVRVRRGAAVTECAVGVGIAIGAHGRRAPLDRELDREFLRHKHPHVGLKRHLRPLDGPAGAEAVRELTGTVEIHGFAGGYCGLNIVETGAVNACMLLGSEFLKRLPSTSWDRVSSAASHRNPQLGRRFQALVPADDTVHSVAQIPFRAKERAKGSILFVGDAAGVIAPLVGDGQAMALESAALAARVLERLPSAPSRAEMAEVGRQWERVWHREFGTRIRISRILQDVVLYPVGGDLVLRCLRLFRSLERYLVKATRGRS